MYRKEVMEWAWRDYKIKKKHRGYEDWKFSQSLYWAHKYMTALGKR